MHQYLRGAFHVLGVPANQAGLLIGVGGHDWNGLLDLVLGRDEDCQNRSFFLLTSSRSISRCSYTVRHRMTSMTNGHVIVHRQVHVGRDSTRV